MDHDILFVGGGPAGYEGAIVAAKKGLKAAVVEMDQLGGTCLQRGCIPTKAILHSVKAVKQINDFAKIGVHIEAFRVSVEEIARRKERIVAKQTRGIELLFKQRAAPTPSSSTASRRSARATSCWPPAPSRPSSPSCAGTAAA